MSPRWRRRAVTGLVTLVAAGFVALLFPLAGLIPVKASSGHLPPVEWFLQFAKGRAIATQSLGVETPPLDDPVLVVRGAAAYEIGCKPCHGAPGEATPVITQKALPPPPQLEEGVERWRPRELYFIVKHGLKFTGMPEWPAAHRDDEVWALVAFLLVLPELSAEGYRDLAHGPAPAPPGTAGEPLEGLTGLEPPQPVSTTCRRCHGVEGRGRGRAFPRLAGQSPEYLEAALAAFAEGRRSSGIMQPVAAALAPEARRELARYYAARGGDGPEEGMPGEPAAIARGEAIARDGVPARGVPSCSDCHGPEPKRRNPAYPNLAGQPAGYLVSQLELLRAGHRGGSPYARLMRPVVRNLTRAQMDDVAAYYASLPAPGAAAGGGER